MMIMIVTITILITITVIVKKIQPAKLSGTLVLETLSTSVDTEFSVVA